jgi:hypothetical protein
MSEKTQQIDETFRETSKPFLAYLAYRLRDEAGYAPYKIRIAVFVNTEEGTHFSEHEQLFDPKEYEEFYQEYISRDIVRQAKDIIDTDKKG